MSRQAWVLLGVVAVATLIGALLLAVRVIRTRRLLGTLGVSGKVAFYGALTYTVLPVDLLPDPIYLDDMGVLAVALVVLGRLARRRQTTAAEVTPRSRSTPSQPRPPRG